ncbi:MAG: RIP metalloprotease RseP [Candidatus Pacebacteria bacterium]|nr:RIP metalloprotease RseP [Candidatus Paceibacterota bacterium]
MIITTIILFLLILGVIVFVHELGHFLVAKYHGVKIEEFGIGFPPKIFGIKKGETEYTLNWIPLGGFVKIVGEDGEDKEDPRSFASKSIGKRFQIISAGVIMNIVLALVLFSVIFSVGAPMDIEGVDLSRAKSVQDRQIKIAGIVEGSPASEAELQVGDSILTAGGIQINSNDDLYGFTKSNIGQTATFTFQRGDEILSKEITLRQEFSEKDGSLGIAPSETAVVAFPIFDAIMKSFGWVYYLITYILFAFAGIIWSLLSVGKAGVEVSGPVGIAVMTQQAASLGLMVVLNFMAIISINLAIINALPFPALDGGRLLFLIVEKIKGSPINQVWEAKANNFGFLLLMGLMVVVTFQDLLKFDVWGRVVGLFG